MWLVFRLLFCCFFYLYNSFFGTFPPFLDCFILVFHFLSLFFFNYLYLFTFFPSGSFRGYIMSVYFFNVSNLTSNNIIRLHFQCKKLAKTYFHFPLPSFVLFCFCICCKLHSILLQLLK